MPEIMNGVDGDLAAAIDLGSNSFHMIIARAEDGPLQLVDKMRERVRLGAGLDEQRNLTKEAEDRALACLERMGERVRSMPPGTVRAVGTNTLRKARNSAAFLERAHEALGHPVEIIAGREEARLIYLGMAQTMPELSGQRLVVDIGGGSTECIIGEGFEILDADSLYMGCVSYSLNHFPDGVLTKKRFEAAIIEAELELQTIAEPYRALGWTTALGCSGTAHAIYNIVRENKWTKSGITPHSLKKLRKALINQGNIASLSIPGLQPDREPVIAGGVAILEAIFKTLEIDEMQPSPGALREGVLYDLVGRIKRVDVRDRTIRWFCERYSVDVAHATRVSGVALKCLSHVAQPWKLEEGSKTLHWAAMLHEIGLSISHTAFHKHSAYIVRNADMAGFSKAAQNQLAAIVRGHRRKLKRAQFSELPRSMVESTLRMCLLFRLGVSLNRARLAEETPKFELTAKGPVLTLTFEDNWLKERPLTRANLQMQAKEFSHVGYKLEINS